jgi:hypothetical protein
MNAGASYLAYRESQIANRNYFCIFARFFKKISNLKIV